MKKVNAILLFAVVLMVVNAGYSRTIDSPYEVGNWRGFLTAAVSYTFDDDLPNQLAIAIPMFNQFGYKATLFEVTSPSWYMPPDWNGLRNAASQGHEIGSHTVDHISLGDVNIAKQTYQMAKSQIDIDVNITSQKCVTLAYPNCSVPNEPLCAQYYIAGRHCQGYIESNTPSDFYQISSIICGNFDSVNSPADFNAKFVSTAASKGWCVYLIHAIDGDNGFSPLPSTSLLASLQYLDAHRSTFWVETFGHVVRYIRERNDVSVSETSNTGDSITLAVTEDLNDTIYNYPVTVRRPLPQNWPSATVSQNGQPVNTSIVQVNSTAYVMFDVVPNGGNIVLSKALPTAPANLTATEGYATVVLDWNDICESHLAGYNIYRSTTSGSGYSKLNDSLLSSSNYEDSNIPHDTTYYYVVTAVDMNSNESGYSNEVFSGLYGDFNGNRIVDMNDLLVFFNFNLWLVNDCNETAGLDLDGDCTANFYEFAVLTKNFRQDP